MRFLEGHSCRAEDPEMEGESVVTCQIAAELDCLWCVVNLRVFDLDVLLSLKE
jgi:hypothetical protein